MIPNRLCEDEELVECMARDMYWKKIQPITRNIYKEMAKEAIEWIEEHATEQNPIILRYKP